MQNQLSFRRVATPTTITIYRYRGWGWSAVIARNILSFRPKQCEALRSGEISAVMKYVPDSPRGFNPGLPGLCALVPRPAGSLCTLVPYSPCRFYPVYPTSPIYPTAIAYGLGPVVSGLIWLCL